MLEIFWGGMTPFALLDYDYAYASIAIDKSGPLT